MIDHRCHGRVLDRWCTSIIHRNIFLNCSILFGEIIILKKYVKCIFKNKSPKYIKYWFDLSSRNQESILLSEAEISKLILSSHPTTCPLDPIPSHLLQAISPEVVPALTHIVSTSLHTGIFPSAFKQARITPLLKKPTLNPTLLGNYRPVFLLTFIAKTLERVVFNQVTAFLIQNNLLDSNQSGFRSGHSTETALLSVVEDLRLARTASKSSLLILLDLSAAFDMVNHQILLSTLEKGHLRNRTPVVWLLPLR